MVKNGNAVLVEKCLIMIYPNKITKKEAKQVLKLLEQITRLETMARVGPYTLGECCDYYATMQRKQRKLRKLLYGTSCFVNLAVKWKMIKPEKKKKKRKSIL